MTCKICDGAMIEVQSHPDDNSGVWWCAHCGTTVTHATDIQHQHTPQLAKFKYLNRKRK